MTHVGGYDPFYVDVTDFLQPTDNEIIVSYYDPSESGECRHQAWLSAVVASLL